MGIQQLQFGDGFLANLRPEFRLSRLAAREAMNAETDHAAETAFALSAELKRRAALLRN